MPTLLNAKNLTLAEVERLLGYREIVNEGRLAEFSLLPLTPAESQELRQIAQDFRQYLKAGKVSEGLVKFLVLAPLMRLAGFYRSPIRLSMEKSLDIAIEDDDETQITGRLDILALGPDGPGNSPELNSPELWILVIESKNSAIEVRQGLPQLLTYAHSSLDRPTSPQASVWGLVTNGLQFLVADIRQGQPPTYELLPEFNLLDEPRSQQLLQVMKQLSPGDRQGWVAS